MGSVLKIKQDWQEWVHKLRKRVIVDTFSRCPQNTFKNGLELGAGDGFQSNILSNYIEKLTSTDYYQSITNNENSESIEYVQCDAEKIGEMFSERKFDIVFSSNLLEHLPNPDKALRGMHEILEDNGIIIPTMPTPFMKI